MIEDVKPVGGYNNSDKLAFALGCLASILAIIIFLVERTPSTVAVLLVLMLALSVYPILHFVKRRVFRVAVAVCVVVGTIALGYHVLIPPPVRSLSNINPSGSQPVRDGDLVDRSKLSDSIAVELKRAQAPIEFSFEATGEGKQRITSQTFPKLIQLEPVPTEVKDDDLPKEVPVTGGTITVLRFGRGFMLFDTRAVPRGTKIRGQINAYVDIPQPQPAKSTQRVAPDQSKGQAEQRGAGSGAAAGNIQQGPCSSLQIGGSNNQATMNCLPPRREVKVDATQLTSILSPLQSRVTFGAIMAAPDAFQYAVALRDAFTNAGAPSVQPRIVPEMPGPGTPNSGVEIWCRCDGIEIKQGWNSVPSASQEAIVLRALRVSGAKNISINKDVSLPSDSILVTVSFDGP